MTWATFGLQYHFNSGKKPFQVNCYMNWLADFLVCLSCLG